MVVFVLCAQEVVEDVDDGGDVALGLPVAVLQRGVERAREGARVDAAPVVVHALDDGAAAAAARTAGTAGTRGRLLRPGPRPAGGRRSEAGALSLRLLKEREGDY